MDFWRSVHGMVEAELTSAALDTAFQAINRQDISVYQVIPVSDLTVRFQIRRKDQKKLAALCEKRGETLTLCGRRGIFWPMRDFLTRPVLIAGLLAFLCLATYLPTRVLFVQVEGNSEVPAKLILVAAEESGIRFGASRREVRSEKMKNALLSAVPQLQWAGVNTAGCVAVISVRERSLTDTEENEDPVSSIVAATDGLIYSCTATQGTLLCSEGEMVRQGQVLISGYTDCGLCIQATCAEGEIYAQTNRKITAIMPAEGVGRGGLEGETKKYSLLFGKNRINLWKGSGISDTSCGRMYEEYYITLPGGFRLPFGIGVETLQFYEMEVSAASLPMGEQLLTQYARSGVLSQTVAGSIRTETVSVTQENGVLYLEGSYGCTEMIGRVQREQIGEAYGKGN
ncbi:MAG: sporulation protein YqfD [Oscillospiraceae bacterium]|nr:sporulation protein YqfD [Oscillospiraceae bacterium]